MLYIIQLRKYEYIIKAVFHFKWLVPTRINDKFSISKFCECWLVNTSVVRSKVDLRRSFYFDTRINRKYVNLKTHLQAAQAHQYVTVRYGRSGKWPLYFLSSFLKSIVYCPGSTLELMLLASSVRAGFCDCFCRLFWHQLQGQWPYSDILPGQYTATEETLTIYRRIIKEQSLHCRKSSGKRKGQIESC
jgi:hypothetical protein